jgi:REP element-mobilizing transposase RayT
MSSAKEINLLRKTQGHHVWQRNYYEHIIRNDKELNNVRDYIINNPMQWHVDEENP